MFKKMFLFLVVGMFILGIGKISFAEHDHGMMGSSTGNQEVSAPEGAMPAQVAAKEAVNVGNKVCPVSGEKIDEKLKATYEYEGKVYNFCCAMCVDTFKNDPQKYIAIVNDELKQEGAAEEDVEGR